jgi:hypothetical protein
MVVMVRVVVAVVLLAVVVQVLLVEEGLPIAAQNVVAMVAQEYQLLLQELLQHMLAVVVGFHKIKLRVLVGVKVVRMVVLLVHLAVVVMLDQILVLVSLVIITLVVEAVRVVTVVETMLAKVVRVSSLSYGNMISWPNLKHESSLKNIACAV